ncbi:MAG TPA: helix-turn-helix domain-containing GNAT family N-acetyltransferase [Bryobacteraceae bacterium]|nr:helix-turn-helix domain-containing GNAT family N-acetyltransferase [Bryobacteraceae bacterium]
MDESPLSAAVSAFREFNRSYTRLIGTLDEGLLRTEYSLPEARVIYELATRTAPNAKEIAEALGMDPGYLSRILSKFENAALIRRTVSKNDNRRADLVLTPRGRKAFDNLNALADRQARATIEPLALSDRVRLIGAMKTIGNILADDDRRRAPLVLRSHRPGDMGLVVHSEAVVYTEEYGWDETFEALAAQIVADFITNFDSRRERCWIAEVDGRHVGHVFLVRHPDRPDTAKLRLLLVERAARGRGLGHILVNECVRFGRSCGYRKITLWTQSILAAAHRIYQGAGFHLVGEEPHHSFGKDLAGQTWELELNPAD